YQNRIKALQMSHGLEEDDRPEPTNIDNSRREPSNGHGAKPAAHSGGGGKGKSTNSVETLKADFDDLVMKEKPRVSWNEVIGIVDAKRAIRESIVFPVKKAHLFTLGWKRSKLLDEPAGCGKT